MSINHHIINRNTELHLRNLIAFEQCYLPAGKKASSYVVLMNNLIGTPEDVAVLSSRGTDILINNLTSEEEVVDLFKNLCKGVDGFHGGRIYEDVDEYYRARSVEWWTELKENYLSSPWKIIALLAAAALLGLTAAQVYYAVQQSKSGKS